MKLKTTHIGVIMAVAVIATAGSAYAFSQLSNSDGDLSSLIAGPMLTGNVKVTHLDEFGNVIGYRQTDNHIVESGMELIMGQIFRGINGSFQVSSSPIDYMEVGTAGEWRVLYNDTDLREYDVVGPAGLCARQPTTNTNSTQGSSTKGTEASPGNCVAPNCFAQYNVTAQATFQGGAPDNCASTPLTIDEAGIWNDPAQNTGLMFARNTFGGVELMGMDTLVLDWEFTFTDN